MGKVKKNNPLDVEKQICKFFIFHFLEKDKFFLEKKKVPEGNTFYR